MAKNLQKMTDDELAEERQVLLRKIDAIKDEVRAIQAEVDRRVVAKYAEGLPPGYTISEVGGIESQEKVGGLK